ncbi:bacteriocin-like protein [Chryseobacterium kwangjuense]|uniref:Bacteriocin-like protein n=1 Tax=Chryseobacterium kwangjuense TaxID=267125 RepID=A0ABW9K6A1_9FLAO
MKNLKKLNREQQKQINGGAIARCGITRPCTVGWCCNGVCSPHACIEL